MDSLLGDWSQLWVKAPSSSLAKRAVEAPPVPGDELIPMLFLKQCLGHSTPQLGYYLAEGDVNPFGFHCSSE